MDIYLRNKESLTVHPLRLTGLNRSVTLSVDGGNLKAVMGATVREFGGEKIRVGSHWIFEDEMRRRMVDYLPKDQFHQILKKIERDLDRE